MPTLFSKLKNQLENEKSSHTDLPFDLLTNDDGKKILRSELIDFDIYDIYKSVPLDLQQFHEDMECHILHPNTG